jgi:CRISPR-associated protein Cmr4
MSEQRLYLLHALAPLHVGVDAGVGAIDLPTLREAHTRYPVIPGSSIKGVLREEAELRHDRTGKAVLAVFGPTQEHSSDSRGGAVFTDAQLLALPVRSFRGTFAWVTCDFVLRRLDRDLEAAGRGKLALPPRLEATGEALLTPPFEQRVPLLAVESPGEGRHRVFLEDLLLDAREDSATGLLAQTLANWIWPGGAEQDDRSFFRDRFLLVHDDVFSFLSESAMEVRARVQLDSESGTVKVGPWSEEHLPAESLLYGLVMGRKTRITLREEAEDEQKTNGGEAREPKKESWSAAESLKVVAGLLAADPVLRFGGHSSVGLGRARVRLVGDASNAPSGGAAGGGA